MGLVQGNTIQDAKAMEDTVPASDKVTSGLGDEWLVHETTGGKNWGGGVKSSVRVLGSACKHHRNSEARMITGGKKSNSSPFERDCKKPLFLSQMSAGNSGSYHPGKDWKQHYVIFHTCPGPIQHSTLWEQHTHHPKKEIKHGLLKVLK